MPYRLNRQGGRWVQTRINRPSLPILDLSSDHQFATEDDVDSPESGLPSSDPTKRAVGNAIVRTEGGQSEVATIRTPDVRAARRDWKAKTIPKYAGLIEATLDPNPTDPDAVEDDQ